MPDVHGQLTDDERLQLYKQCKAQQGFDILGAIRFFGGLATGNLEAVAQPFIDGIGQQGCDVFLTDMQKADRARAERQNDMSDGNQGPPGSARNGHF